MQLRHRAELLRQPAHADMRAKFRHHPRQRGDLLVAFDQAVSIDFQEQPGRQRALLGQQQGQPAEEFLAAARAGRRDGQLTFVRGQPLQAQRHRLQVAVGHQVQPYRWRDEERGGMGIWSAAVRSISMASVRTRLPLALVRASVANS